MSRNYWHFPYFREFWCLNWSRGIAVGGQYLKFWKFGLHNWIPRDKISVIANVRVFIQFYRRFISIFYFRVFLGLNWSRDITGMVKLWNFWNLSIIIEFLVRKLVRIQIFMFLIKIFEELLTFSLFLGYFWPMYALWRHAGMKYWKYVKTIPAVEFPVLVCSICKISSSHLEYFKKYSLFIFYVYSEIV